jgi:hypothetical protein
MQLICVAVAGLSNRIRTLLGAKELADQTGRELVTYWPSSRECGSRWHDLFEPSIREISKKPKIDFPITNQRTKPQAMELRLRHAAQAANRPEIAFKSYALGKLSDTIRYFDAIFRPIAPIAERVAQTIASFNGPVLGVHVRCGDFRKHNRLPPGALANRFLKAVPELMRELSAEKIYLATDDGAERELGKPRTKITYGIYQQFAETLGTERIIRQPSVELDRNSAQGVQDALVDLLVLRQCDANCGQLKSSYSELAGIGKKNVLLRI